MPRRAQKPDVAHPSKRMVRQRFPPSTTQDLQGTLRHLRRQEENRLSLQMSREWDYLWEILGQLKDFVEREKTQKVNDVSKILEAIIRAHGGKLEIYNGRMLNLTGNLVISGATSEDPQGVTVIQTKDRAEGRWVPEHKGEVIMNDEDALAYAKRLADARVTTIDQKYLEEIAHADQVFRDSVRSLVHRIVEQAIEDRKTMDYIEAIEQQGEDEDDERPDRQPVRPSSVKRPRGVIRG